MPEAPRGAVLLLHGGRADGLGPPPLVNLPGFRMRPFGSAIRRAPGGDGVLLGSVRYRLRGWNGDRADPVRDAREALAELEFDGPVVLVGHSMGGRTALRAAADPRVRGVVGLAPWCPPREPVAHLAGKRVLLLHDEADRVTAARGSWAFLDRAGRAGALARGVVMPAGGHTMLRGAADWHRLAAALTLAALGTAPLPAALADGAEPGVPVPAARVLTGPGGGGG
ncbi:alpha/beta hydrolase [Streptomyces sp. LP05-1]|uniref:Alpha/beta hydrolase n=2 Tax=Streptomyces pyxinae TaxID=2970734 RepID=A0ABT2CKE6_9ACTN|nr:alpha/beta hydrolase [Streptomyces sp. LP05-1]